MEKHSNNMNMNMNNTNYILSRQRSMPAIKTNTNIMHKTLHHHPNTTQVTSTCQPKAIIHQLSSRKPMQIYRPPNKRESINKDSALVVNHDAQFNASDKKLNVNAKEFVINDRNINIKTNEYGYGASKEDGFNYVLSASKSQSYITNSSSKSKSSKPSNYSIERTKSNTTMKQNNKVQFKIPSEKSNNDNKEDVKINLKRSKSMNCADFKSNNISGSHIIFEQLELFPINLRNAIKTAIIDVEIKDFHLINLAEKMVEYAIMNKTHAEVTAKVSILIIQGDSKSAYIDAMINICHLYLQEKHNKLMTSTNTFPAFFIFIYQLYAQLKRTQLFSSLPEYQSLLLSLIGTCCEECLLGNNNMRNADQMESLFVVLMNIGNELEVLLPACHRKIYNMLRNVILLHNDTEQIKKTALQLIEIRAAKYRLPSSALTYYYSK